MIRLSPAETRAWRTSMGLGLRRARMPTERRSKFGAGDGEGNGMPSALTIVGERYGRLVASQPIGPNHNKKMLWRFVCDCGNTIDRVVANVRSRDTMSCGCLKRDNRLEQPAFNRLGAGESSFRALLAVYRKRAKELQVEFSLPMETFRGLTQRPCVYCGAAPIQSKRANVSSNGVYRYNGLDRVDNDAGYTEANTVPACGMCNRAKNNRSLPEFADWVRRVAARLP